jgi:hypothetical protein
VLVSLSNDEGLLLPGMNGDVSLVVERRLGVLAVPVDAVRSLREAQVLAPSLGLVADSVRAQLASLPSPGGGSAPAGGARDSVATGFAGGGRGDAMRQGSAGGWRGAGTTGRSGDQWRGEGMGQGFPGGGRRDSLRARFAGGAGRDSMRARWARRASGGGQSFGGATNRAQVVFVKTARGIEPRRVQLGLSDFDWSEVLAGVHEGEQVVLLGVAQAQASRSETQANIRQRVGNMPGSLGGTRGGGGGRSRP